MSQLVSCDASCDGPNECCGSCDGDVVTISLLNSLDELFAGVVMAPSDWSDQRIGEWMSGIDADSTDREAIKILNRGIRRATRLRKYWLLQTEGAEDWQQRVDQALGGEGWRVSLDLAIWSLGANPDPCCL